MSEQPTQSRSGDLNPTDPQDATNPATIEPDPTATDQPETDSAYGDDTDAQSDTTSLMSEVLNFKYENGRRYHSYREGEYVLPNDEAEQDRQDILHHVRNLVLDGALYRAPLKADIQRALDIGTGTGIWAIDFADQFPTAEVIGTDLSPIQPSWVPPNLSFHVDDATSEWTFNRSKPFDYIHIRDLGGSISEWPALLRQAYEYLRPGGWLELQEYEVTLKADDDTMKLAPTLNEYLEELHKASEMFKKPLNVAEGHKQKIIDAGFKDVQEEIYKTPSSQWPKNPHLKQIGKYNQAALQMAVESYSLALFTRVLGWSNEKTQVFLAGVRKDIANVGVHSYCNLHVIYGQRPITTI